MKPRKLLTKDRNRKNLSNLKWGIWWILTLNSQGLLHLGMNIVISTSLCLFYCVFINLSVVLLNIIVGEWRCGDEIDPHILWRNRWWRCKSRIGMAEKTCVRKVDKVKSSTIPFHSNSNLLFLTVLRNYSYTTREISQVEREEGK